MREKLKSFETYSVLDIVDWPNKGKMKIMKNKWVLTIKRAENGGIKFKVRLVIAGFNIKQHFYVKHKNYEDLRVVL